MSNRRLGIAAILLALAAAATRADSATIAQKEAQWTGPAARGETLSWYARFTAELQGLEYELSGGVSDSSIQSAAASIGTPFPLTYVEFLRHCGSGFISFHELIGLGGPPHLDVVIQTRFLRNHSRISRFPPHLIPVLADGFGNYECLDASSRDTEVEFPVVQWLHDGGDEQALRVLSPSYEEWLRGLVAQIRVVEAGD